MRDWDSFDDIFKRIEEIMNDNLSGGYQYKSRDGYKESEEDGVIYDGRDMEMLDFGDYITVTAELRGVRDEDLEVKPEENSITLQFMYDGIWRKRPFRFPDRVNPSSAEINYNNHILDIKVSKINGEDILRPDSRMVEE